MKGTIKGHLGVENPRRGRFVKTLKVVEVESKELIRATGKVLGSLHDCTCGVRSDRVTSFLG